MKSFNETNKNTSLFFKSTGQIKKKLGKVTYKNNKGVFIPNMTFLRYRIFRYLKNI